MLIRLCRFAEVKATEVNPENLGKELSVAEFEADTWIDVTGTSKGKGFAGVMKRHNFLVVHGSRSQVSQNNRFYWSMCYPGRAF